MPISLIPRMPFFANIVPHRRADSNLILGQNGQPSIINSDPPAGLGDVPYNPQGSRRPEYAPQPATQISPDPISATGMQTGGQLTQSEAFMTTVPALAMTSATATDTISSSLSSATSSSSFSSQTRTTTSTPSNSSSSTSTSTHPTALVSPASMHTSRTELSAPFYVAIILGTVCVLACCLAFLAWWMRSRASVRKTQDDDELWTARDTLEDGPEPSLQMHTPHEESEFYLPASLVRRNTGDPFSSPINATFYNASRTVVGNVHPPMEQRRPALANSASAFSVQENPRTLGRLQVANIAPGDLTSGDESSHGGPTFYSTRVAELGPPRNAVQYPTQNFLPQGDGLPQFLPSPRHVQRTPRERLRPVMENTPGIGPTDWHDIPLPDEAEPGPHDVVVNEHRPPEGWASALKSNFMTAFGTVAGNRTQRPSTYEESDIPLGSAKIYSLQRFPDPEFDIPLAGHDPPSYSTEAQLNDDVNGLRIRGLGGHPRERVSSPDVSQSNLEPSDSQVTLRPDMTPVWTHESRVPLKHNAAPIGMAKDKSHASYVSSSSVYTSESIAAASANLKNYGYGFIQSHQALSPSDIPKSRTNTMQSEQSKVSSRKRGGQRRRSRPKPTRHESSSASSMISFGSDLLRPPQPGYLSGRESMARRALLERRRKMLMYEPLDE
ncbi:uncharacterized protein EDB93DRAFT_754490 [Suillus bovinus]|uniref:uncharacterized protein n=1 Tax=Suillus bovinus TaxID=48563 RepID=UPI001B86C98E|nr:uncharacterized protein EDB93DRAFT_754490 [Suillus bovinus]KAG2137868.1 hypothetical protein EDB93DRAFT_754490 [Suillus bovinus]